MLKGSLVTVKLVFDNAEECLETCRNYKERGWKIKVHGRDTEGWYFHAEIEQD